MKRVVLLVLAALIGAGAFYYYSLPNGEAQGPPKPEVRDLGTFTVNLSGPGNHYAGAAVSVEYAGQEAASELSEKEARVKDAVLQALRSCTLEDLSERSRGVAARARLLEAVNGALERSKVKALYFTDLIMQ